MNSEQLTSLTSMLDDLQRKYEAISGLSEQARQQQHKYQELAEEACTEADELDLEVKSLGDQVRTLNIAVTALHQTIQESNDAVNQEVDLRNAIFADLEKSTGVERHEIIEACERQGTTYIPYKEQEQDHESDGDQSAAA